MAEYTDVTLSDAQIEALLSVLALLESRDLGDGYVEISFKGSLIPADEARLTGATIKSLLDALEELRVTVEKRDHRRAIVRAAHPELERSKP